MRNIIIILFFLFFLTSSFSEEIYVKGDYSSIDPITKFYNLKWKIVKEDNVISFYLKDSLKSKVYFNNKEIIEIINFKLYKNKIIKFKLNDKTKILREIKSTFIPYNFVLKHFNINVQTNYKQTYYNNFKVVKTVK